jgi:hypothetical protein
MWRGPDIVPLTYQQACMLDDRLKVGRILALVPTRDERSGSAPFQAAFLSSERTTSGACPTICAISCTL